MSSERPSELHTSVILVNELHFLALEERLKLIETPNSKSLDALPISRLIGSAEVSDNTRPITEGIELWETLTSYPTYNLKVNYNLWTPTYSNFSLQSYSDKLLERGYTRITLSYLELQVDVFPETRNIYRLCFKNRCLPRNSITRNTALGQIAEYKKTYDLYPEIKTYDERNYNLWLGRLHCLELYKIFRGDKGAKGITWYDKRGKIKAKDVTEKYLKNDPKLTGSFFQNLEERTGKVIDAARKLYDDTDRGWVLDGLLNPRMMVPLKQGVVA